MGNLLVKNIDENTAALNRLLAVEENFDIVSRNIIIGGRKAGMYFVNGFCKDELVQKLLQKFMELKEKEMPKSMQEMAAHFTSYVEVETTADVDRITQMLLSGVFVLLIDEYEEALLIDSRTYPARGVEEPSKDKVLRGSKDGFVETIIFNTALIRRRIRSENLRMEILNAGASSKTDIVLCYMEDRVNQKFLKEIRTTIKNIKTDSLTMNQESLAECIYKKKWYNPFPKFKYTERPDAASAHILEGDIIILVDNSPSAMILPITIFDIADETDDYYFPPITGTYLRLTRFIISIMTYFLTPTFLLFINHPQWIPERFAFIMLSEEANVALIWQFLMLELAIDGLKLAAINTPNMLSTPLSVLAALVLGEFAVKSGWFSAEVMLYMAFVAIANYTQANYELGYALKFLRILNLCLTQLFGLPGYIGGVIIALLALAFNRTIDGGSYIYPLIPFDWKELKTCFIRKRERG